MKRTTMKRVMTSSIVLAMAGLVYTGCGGSDSNSATPTGATTYSGVVADGYIDGATVCLDLDGNGTCDATDPQGVTDANGKYTLSTTVTLPSTAKILAYGGTDTYTGESFSGKLQSPLDLKDGTSNHLTPLTTLVAAYLDNNSTATTSGALSQVATAFGVDASMIKGDPFAKLSTGTTDEKPKASDAIKKAYAVQKAVEMFKAAAPTLSEKEIFKAIAKAGTVDVDSIASKNTTLNGLSVSKKVKIKDVVDAISAMSINSTSTLDDLKKKQKAIQVATEIVNSNGTTTISGTLLTTLEGSIGTKKVDVKAMAASLGGTKIVDTNMSNDAATNTEKTNTTTAKQTVTIDFGAVVGDQGDLMCTDANGVAKQYTVGSASSMSTIADFRYFVSDIKLTMSDGTTKELKLFNNYFQYYSATDGAVAILDFEDNTGDCVGRGNDALMNKVLVGTVDSTATVTGIEFTVGVPMVLNHTEFPTARALSKTSMAWSWASGRKFTKLEVNPVDGSNLTSDIFPFHLGSTGCSSASGSIVCAQPNRVKMNFALNPSTQKIVLDYSKLLTHVDVTKKLGGSPGCMSALNDQECMSTTGKMFNMIGLDDAGEQGLCTGGDCTSNQKLFSVKAK